MTAKPQPIRDRLAAAILLLAAIAKAAEYVAEAAALAKQEPKP